MPRPLLALLVVVVAFFAAWTLVLKPHASTEAASAPQAAQPVSPPSPRPAGHGAPSLTGGRSPAAGGSAAPRTAWHEQVNAATHAATGARAGARPAKAKARHARRSGRPAFTEPATAQSRASALVQALKADKVVALLFYNPAGADDLADYQALTDIPDHGGRVVRLAVPIAEIARYSVVTQQVPVTGSPTLVVIDGDHRAQTLVGFADQLEFDQRVAGALAAR